MGSRTRGLAEAFGNEVRSGRGGNWDRVISKRNGPDAWVAKQTGNVVDGSAGGWMSKTRQAGDCEVAASMSSWRETGTGGPQGVT